MRSVIVLVVFSLAAAGCVTPEAPEDAAVEAASVGSETPAPAGPEAADGTTAAPVATVPQAFPFAFDGTTSTYVCAPSGVGSCQGEAFTESDNTFVEMEYEGAPSAAEVTLTWEPASPATNEMYISLFAGRSCGEGCIETTSEMFHAYLAGTSPLALSVPTITLAQNETLYLHVGTNEPNPSVYPVLLFYGLDQAFSVEGTLTALVPAAG